MALPDTQLVLIRHGESVAQVEGFLSGHDTCRGLSENGRAQAVALRDRLIATSELGEIDAVYTSILPRTIETAAIIAPALGEARPYEECGWCEIHAGEAEGLSWDEFQQRYPVVGDPYNPFRRRMPGAETWAEFYLRVGARLRRVAEDHPNQRVVVVCHGGVVGASFIALGDLPIGNGTSFMREVLNTSLTEWRWTGSDWRLVRFNDAAHLPAPPE